MKTRLERDSLGEMPIPCDAYYGIHAARARDNFVQSGERVRPELIAALAQVKQACALANAETGYLEPRTASAIVTACGELNDGKLHDQIIVDPYQGGAGTSTNMNANEVIANRAIELLGGELGDYALVDPLDHVNLHQSTNDTYPTALKVAAIKLLRRLEEAVIGLQAALQDKEKEFAGVVKMGRTEMQDAVPTTLGRSMAAFAEAIARDRWRVFKCEERLRVVNLGGTAIGTGLTAPRAYIFLAIEKLREVTGLGIARAENMIDATQNHDPFVEVSGIMRALAVDLGKIANDLRLMSSGPRTGFGEIRLPELQAGSSIMPGKVNPVVPEMVNQVAMKVIGSDSIITQVCLNGQLELNAFLPLLAHELLGSLKLLLLTCEIFSHRCIRGIEANADRCREHVERSWGIVTALVPAIGYHKAAEVAELVKANGVSVREAVLDMKLLSDKELDDLLRPEALTALGFVERD